MRPLRKTGTECPIRASKRVMLDVGVTVGALGAVILGVGTVAVSVPVMVLVAVLGVLAVGIIAWLLPRPDSSLVVRSSAPDDEPNRRPAH